MIVKYNTLNRLEVPKLSLCNPGSIYQNGLLTNMVGILTDTEAEELVLNFNATSELNFRVNRIQREDPEENTHILNLYKAIQNRRLIFVEDIGYFMITNIDDGYANGIRYKDIKAKSIDIEIQQKMIPYIADGTYKFTSDATGTQKGILETIVEVLPLWTIGDVDETVAERWRTFEDVDTSLNCLGFLLENIQDAYECIIVFDCINRIINVYAQDNYVRQTDIHITKDDVINSIDITENADDLYTAISVLGDENVTISAINPLGTNVIYDFTYYLDWMSEELKEKVITWQNDIEAARERYYKLNLYYYDLLQKTTNIEMEIERLNIQIKMYNRCRENIVAESNVNIVNDYNTVVVENGGTEITICDEIKDTLEGINTLIANCENDRESKGNELYGYIDFMARAEADIENIHQSLNIITYFEEKEYNELSNYIFEGSYTDDYVTITDNMTYEEKFAQMKTLYNRAKARLDRVSQPTQEFAIDVENFLFEKEFARWSEQLETGCLINVELDLNDIALLFLSNITVNYDDRTLSMTFGNRFNKFDPKSLFENVLGDISKSANTLNYIKEILYPIKNGEFNSMREALQNSRNLTMNKAIASTNEEVIIDGSGYTGRRLDTETGEYDPHQVKLTSKNMVFTSDAWDSCRTAIGELSFGNGATAYGINAEVIIGDMIVGNNIRIVDNDGNDMFTVMDGKISASVRGVNEKLTLITQTAEGLNIRVNNVEGKGINQITTTTGYTFNADGLTICKSGEEMKNLLDNTGMKVTRSGEEILTANNEGVSAINLTASQYLTVGTNSRFENYSNGRTACFYIGD